MTTTIDDPLYQQVRIRPYGERGYLLDQLSDAERFKVEHALTLNAPEAFGECVIGAENLLLLFARPVSIASVERWLFELQPYVSGMPQESRHVTVPVVYDGADLADVARQTGMCVDAVVQLHTAPTYRVRMVGFAPGFPYLDGLDARLHLERKASPRNRIEPGTVAIGGSHAGIYSVASPGGWHLLGRTELPLFQATQARGTVNDPSAIFLLAAGDTLEFTAI